MKIALELKKLFVDNEQLEITQARAPAGPYLLALQREC